MMRGFAALLQLLHTEKYTSTHTVHSHIPFHDPLPVQEEWSSGSEDVEGDGELEGLNDDGDSGSGSEGEGAMAGGGEGGGDGGKEKRGKATRKRGGGEWGRHGCSFGTQ